MPSTNPQPSKAKSAKSTQEFLAVESVREGVIILKNGGLRAILMASSLNFALKSAEEQEATIFQYQNFLNSIDFSLQIVIESRKLNILPYLDLLKKRGKEETNELLKIQIDEYMEFVRSFVELSSIVAKNFYLVIPFDPGIADIAKQAKIGSIFSFFSSKESGAEAGGDNFDEYKNQLQQRIDQVALGLVRFGVRTAQLNTEEIVELLYGLYNPGEIEKKTLSAE